MLHKADYNYGCIRNIGDGFMIFIYKYLILTFIICKIYRKPSIFPRQIRKEEYFNAVIAICHKIYLKTHVIRYQVPFSYSKCDYVSLTLKDVENLGKWYGPHKTRICHWLSSEQLTHLNVWTITLDVGISLHHWPIG